MAKADWIVKMYSTASRAARQVKPDAFPQRRRGLVMSRPAMWGRENPILLARWKNDVLLVVLDGSERNRGKLMLVQGVLAYEVTATVEVLESIYAPHLQSKWWIGQTLHRCEPLPKAS